jgi:quinol monooxygenase YgiN
VLSLEIHVDVEPEKRREFLLAAESLLQRSAAEESPCRDRRVFEQHGDPNHFLWREEWLDRTALDRRMASNEFRALLGALRVLGQAHDLRITSVEQKSNEEMVT